MDVHSRGSAPGNLDRWRVLLGTIAASSPDRPTVTEHPARMAPASRLASEPVGTPILRTRAQNSPARSHAASEMGRMEIDPVTRLVCGVSWSPRPNQLSTNFVIEDRRNQDGDARSFQLNEPRRELRQALSLSPDTIPPDSLTGSSTILFQFSPRPIPAADLIAGSPHADGRA